MPSDYAVKNIRRDLEKLNLGEIRKLAKERGFDKKDAALYGNAQRRSTWVKMLVNNTPEFHDQPQEKPKQKEVKPRRNKPVIPAIKQRVIYGLKRLPTLKLISYSYRGTGV